MKKTLGFIKNVCTVYGALSLTAFAVGAVVEAKKTAKTEKAEKTEIHKKHGKTYFKVQNQNHETTEPMGFHLG